MADRQALALRGKMLGATMRMVRKAAGKSLKDAAALIGISSSTLSSYETGRKSISLPELEIYAFHLGVPLRRFWDYEETEEESRIAGDDIEVVLGLRNRMIAAVLHGQREEAGMSARQLAQASGLTTSRVNAYAHGDRAIPVPHLEAMAAALGRDVKEYVDRQGPIGDWDAAQRALQVFLRMPMRLREFVADPDNRPYLELARRMTDLSIEKLRAVGEGLLDIAG
jgi:transcriptional regulator with XRE-family HTH domain